MIERAYFINRFNIIHVILHTFLQYCFGVKQNSINVIHVNS